MSTGVTNSHPKIYGAIIAAKRKITAVGKHGKVNQYGNYEYRKFDDVLDAVAPFLNEFGIVVVPDVVEKTERQDGKSHYVTIKVQYQFFAEDGSSIIATSIGEAFDVGDKASTKAQTVAFRIVLVTVLNIPYEMIDPESGPQVEFQKTDSVGTYSRLIAALDSMIDTSKFKGVLLKAIDCATGKGPAGESLTIEQLSQSKDAFCATARRLRFTERVVRQVEADIDKVIVGARGQSKQEPVTEQKTETAKQAVSETVEIIAEVAKFKDIDFDFSTAADVGAREKCVVTTIQSFFSDALSFTDVGTLIDKHCPEDESMGQACFLMTAIYRGGSAVEVSTMAEFIVQGVQSGKIGKECGNALSQFAQRRIETITRGAQDNDPAK